MLQRHSSISTRALIFAACSLLLGAFVFPEMTAQQSGAPILGNGSEGRIAKFTATDRIGASDIREDSNGNVGIGVAPLAQPSIKLLVNGRIGAHAGTSGTTGALLVNQNGSGPIATFRTNRSDVKMVVTSAGDVGIGTTTPTASLDVAGAIAVSGREIVDSSGRFVGDPGTAGLSPLRIATLRWYEANLTGVSFRVGNAPVGVAFDGTHIWTANLEGTVTKIRVLDKAVLGTFPVAGICRHIAFDGTNVWVTDEIANTVVQVRADGTVRRTVPVGDFPQGVAFDGQHIWVANTSSDSLTKIQATNGTVIGTYPVGNGPVGVAFDGVHVWTANCFESSVTKVRGSDGVVVGSFSTEGRCTRGIAFDGRNIWTANQDSDSVTKLSATDGTILGTFPVGHLPQCIVFDGQGIWVTNLFGNSVTKLRASNGQEIGTFDVGSNVTGIAFDGIDIWVANTSSSRVVKF